MQLIGFKTGDSFLYRLSGTSKLLFFIIVSIVSMTTYDTRLLLFIAVSSLLLFKIAGIKLKDYAVVLIFVLIFSCLNLVMIYLFAPEYGVHIYGHRTIVFTGIGMYTVTLEQLFYLFNVGLKYICTVPLAILFLTTTHPSQFASSLTKIGVNYKIAYAVNLTLRYIPDLQEEYHVIKQAQEARGLELSKKSRLVDRIKGHLQIVMPLIFSSLERINSVSQSMELRRFGRYKKRTWYMYQPFAWQDVVVIGIALLIVLVGIALLFVNEGRFFNPWK